MKRIPQRELRNDVAAVLRRVATGERLCVTPGGGWATRRDHGAWGEAERGTVRGRLPLATPPARRSPACALAPC